MKKGIILAAMLVICLLVFSSCDETSDGTSNDIYQQKEVANTLSANQGTPTDITYSLERYNLVKRAYWVNGQREKANALICSVEKPLGYIVLFAGNTVVGRFVVDGKVTCLNSFLTPSRVERNVGNGGILGTEMADVDGSYGENDAGIFFFTPEGNYIEWTGEYLYSDIPFTIDNPTVKYEVAE